MVGFGRSGHSSVDWGPAWIGRLLTGRLRSILAIVLPCSRMFQEVQNPEAHRPSATLSFRSSLVHPAPLAFGFTGSGSAPALRFRTSPRYSRSNGNFGDGVDAPNGIDVTKWRC